MKNTWEELANAVVLQAVKDWRDSVKKLKNGRKNTNAQDMKDECEKFFKSPEFSIFTAVDGNLILMKLQREVVA